MKLYSYTKEFPLVGKLTLISDEDYLYGICWTETKEHENKLTKIMEQTIKELEEYFSGKRIDFSVPYKINSGTDFQKSVWDQLIQIPHSSAISYQELANRVNKPKASRAVGNANRANPIAIIIPCHRVIKKDKTLGGYAGTKTNIKENLLKLENYDFT